MVDSDPPAVTMTCMTTKKKFDVVDPDVIVLKNNRFAYRALCPWPGKDGKELIAFKFCSRGAYEAFKARALTATSDETPEAPAAN